MDNGNTLTVSLDDLEKEQKPLTVDLDQLDKPAAPSPTDLANQALAKSGVSVSTPKEPEPKMQQLGLFSGQPDEPASAPKSKEHGDYAAYAAGGMGMPEMRPEDAPTDQDNKQFDQEFAAPIGKAVRDTAAASIKGLSLGAVDPHKGTLNIPLTQTDSTIDPMDPSNLVGNVPGLGMMLKMAGVDRLPTSLHMYPETAPEDRSATIDIDTQKIKEYGDPFIAQAINSMVGNNVMPPNPDILPGKLSTTPIAEGGAEMLGSMKGWGKINQLVDAMGIKLLDHFGVKGLATVSGKAAVHDLLPQLAGAAADSTVKTATQALENAVQRMSRNEAVRRIAGQTATGSIFEMLRPRMGPEQAPDLNITQYEQNLTESASKLGAMHDELQKSRAALDAARTGVNNKDKGSVDQFNQMVLQHNAQMAEYQMQAEHYNKAMSAYIDMKKNPDLISTHPVGEGESLGSRAVGGAEIGMAGGLSAELLGLIAKAHADKQFGNSLSELHQEVSDALLSKQKVQRGDGTVDIINSREKADQVAADLINQHLSPDATTKEVKTAAKIMRDSKEAVAKYKGNPAAPAAEAAPPTEPPPSAAPAKLPEPEPKAPQGGGEVAESAEPKVVADLADLKKPTIETEPVKPEENPVTRGESVVVDHEGEQKQGTVTFAAKAGKGTWVKVKLDDGQTVKVEQSDLGRPTEEKPVPENSGGGNNYTEKELADFKAKHNIPEVKSEKVGEESSIKLSETFAPGDAIQLKDGSKGKVIVATKSGVKVKTSTGTHIIPHDDVTLVEKAKEAETKKTPFAEYKGKHLHEGNIVADGDYMANGYMMVPRSAVAKEHIAEVAKPHPDKDPTRSALMVKQEAAKQVWDKATSANSVPVTLGNVHHLPASKAGYKKTPAVDAVELLNKNGKAVSALDARRAKHIMDVTGANHVETTGRDRAAVFYKDSNPVGVLMPLQEPRVTGERKPNQEAKDDKHSYHNKGKSFQQNAEPGTRQAHPHRWPEPEDVPTREYRDEYSVDKLPHPYDKKLPKAEPKRTERLKEALAGLKKQRAGDMATYADRLKKARENPEGESGGYDNIGNAELTYNHLTATNTHIANIEKELGLPISVKEAPRKQRPKYERKPPAAPGKTEFTEDEFKRAKEIANTALNKQREFNHAEPKIAPHDLFRDSEQYGFKPIDTDYDGALHLMRQMVERGDLKLDEIIPAYRERIEPGGSHAVQKPGAEGVLQREPSEAGEAGSGRGRMEPGQQGQESAPAGEEKPGEPRAGSSDAEVPAAPIAKGSEVAATTEDGKQVEGKVVDITANQHGGKVDVLTKDGKIETVPKDAIQTPAEPKKETYGGGPFTIYKMAGLTDRQRAVEKKVATWAQKHSAEAIRKLLELPESRDGHYISGDLAREIFPEYNESPKTRTEFDLAVANTAAAVAKAAFEQELKSSGIATRVILLAGNPGAGKTTAFEGDTLVHPNESNYLVYEASIASEAISADRIKQVIDSGHNAAQVYIYADPMVAFRSTLDRADDYGRTVPIDTQVNLVTTMPKVLEQLFKQYGDQITFKVYDNSARVSPVPEITVDHLLRIAYNGDANDLRQQLQTELDRLHDAGEIPDEIYEAVRSRRIGTGQENPEQLPKGSAEEKGIASLIDAVYAKLKSGESLGNVTEMNKLAEEKLGSSRVSGKWTPKDVFDAMEAGINKYLLDRGKELMEKPVNDALAELRGLLERVTSQGVRTDEQIKNQQFSTPPTISYVVSKVAGVDASDVVLEPSAGNGGLAIWAKAIGAKVYVNEISPRRQAMLEAIGFDKASGHDGEILNALLDRDIKPTVVVMNPPFSASTQKSYEAKNRNQYGFNHVDSALQRLTEGGRLVAILGGGRADDTNGGATLTTGPSGKWFERIAKNYNVRANVRIHGREYQKYGTAFATRIIVIDKDGPTPSQVAPGEIKTWDSVKQGNFDTLEAAYADVLGTIAESRPARTERAAVASAGQSATGLGPDTGVSVPSGRAGVRPGKRTRGQVEPASGPERPAGELAGDQSGEGDQRTPLHQPEPSAERPAESPATESAGSGDQDGRVERPIPSAAAEPGIDLERVAEATDLKEQEDTSSFVAYRPSIKGAAHPGAIVETKTMATVPLPPLTYKPSLPQEIIDKGLLSAVQLEAVAIAGMQNDIVLPSGHRATAVIGDGTGVGKGREISGILLDNWNKGRRRQIWVSEKWDLLPDAQRDLRGIGADHLANTIKPLGKISVTTPIDHEGIVFTTYALVRSEDKKGNKRIEQLRRWLSGNDDADKAYMAFDESHNLKNAVAAQGGQVSQIGSAVKTFLDHMPNLRTVSVSATAASEVINLGYLDRLGLWGPGTAFPNGFAQFAAEIGTGGMSAMEMIARELKAQGKYISRTLSYRGVVYKEVQHEITPEQKEVYRSAVKAWRAVSERIEHVIQNVTNGGGFQKSRAMSAFYSSQQRFFNVLLTTLKLPTVIADAEAALAQNKSVVISLVNTNEAAQNREKNKYAAREDQDEIPDYDFGPGEMLMQLVREHFPIQQFKDDVDSSGKPIKTPVYVTDNEGRQIPLTNPEAVKERDELLARLKRDLHMPENPLDILIQALGGHTKVAEITGRKERFDVGSGQFVSRGGAGVKKDDINKNEEQKFHDGKKRVALLSAAGGTGISLHAGHDMKNQQQRHHITAQVGWSADKAMQMLGRTNRSNQVMPPEYSLVKSNLGGETRFISTIARRLGSLEALSKGQTKTNEGTDTMSKVNFETEQGRAATRAFYDKLLQNQVIPGTETGDGQPLTGMQILTDLAVLKKDPKGGHMTVPDADRTNVTRLLNRLLALDPDVQNAVYEYFYAIFQATIRAAIQDGTLDTGVRTMPGDEFDVKDQRMIATDPKTGAATFYYPVNAHVRTNRVSPNDLAQVIRERSKQEPELVYRAKIGKVMLTLKARPIVHANGTTTEAVYLITPSNGNWTKIPKSQIWDASPIDEQVGKLKEDAQKAYDSAKWQLDYANKDFERNQGDDWAKGRKAQREEALDGAQKNLDQAIDATKNPMQWAKAKWKDEYAEAPSHLTVEHHLIGGAVLHWWNPIKEAYGERLRIYTTTDSKTGKRVVGIEIPPEKINQLLSRISGNQSTVNGQQIVSDVMNNNMAYRLDGGITITRGRVGGYNVVLLKPRSEEVGNDLKRLGVIYERGAVPRYYLPTSYGEDFEGKAKEIMDRVLQSYPAQAPESLDQSIAPFGWDKIDANPSAPAADYEPPRGSVPPVITVNPASLKLMHKAYPEGKSFRGLSMGKAMSRYWAHKLRVAAEDGDFKTQDRDTLNKLAQMFEKASDEATHSGIVVAQEGAGKVLAEEMFHSGQRYLGSGATEYHLPQPAVERLMQHPVGQKAIVWLEQNGYEDKEDALMVAETAAKIAVFDSDIYNALSPEEAADWFTEYLDEVAKAHSIDSLQRFADRITDAAMGLFERARYRVANRRKAAYDEENPARGSTEGEGGSGEASQDLQLQPPTAAQESPSANDQAGAPEERPVDDSLEARAKKAPPFFLKSEQVVTEKMGNSASGFGVLQMLKNAGVKADELKWTGLDDLLRDKAKVTKQEVLDALKRNDIRVQEVHKGTTRPEDEMGAPALQWPDIAQYETKQITPHWKKEPEEVHVYTPIGEEDLKIVHYLSDDTWAAWEGNGGVTNDGLGQLIAQNLPNYHDAQLVAQENRDDDVGPARPKSPEEEAVDRALNAENQASFDLVKVNDNLRSLVHAFYEDRPDLLNNGLTAEIKAENAVENANVTSDMHDYNTPDTWPKELTEAFLQSNKAYMRLSRAATARVVAQGEARAKEQQSTKWSHYKLEGGENYQEHLLTWPAAGEAEIEAAWNKYREVQQAARDRARNGPHTDPFRGDLSNDVEAARAEAVALRDKHHPERFKSSHWEEHNILAHVRTTDRIDADGKKLLFLEELQSDWHQQGRKRGYTTPEIIQRRAEIKKQIAAAAKEADDIYAEGGLGEQRHGRWNALHDEAHAYAGQGKMELANKYRDIVKRFDAAMKKVNDLKESLLSNSVPDAPFKTTWHELALKRMIRMAAERGYDKLAWTTGTQQNERYSLSKVVSGIAWDPTTEQLLAKEDNSWRPIAKVPREELPDHIGVEVSKKLLEQPVKPNAYNSGHLGNFHELHGKDMEVGGSGMKGFYDKIVPEFLNKYAKKWGTRVEPAHLGMSKPAKVYHDDEDNGGTGDYLLEDQNGSFMEPRFSTREEAERALTQQRKHSVPVDRIHALPITQAMKDSVLYEGQPMFNVPPGGSGGGSGTGAAPAKFKFSDEDTEKEFEEARGIEKPSGLEKARETLDRFVKMSTRTYEHLPRGPMYEPLRFELKKLEKGRAMAADEAARYLHRITGDLDKTQFYNFSVKVILDDLAETAKDGLEIPFYGSLEELEKDHAAITAHVANDQAVQQALNIRKAFWNGLKANYIRAMEDIGFKVANRFARESYYRHQVIQYANAKGNLNSNNAGKLKTPTGRGFLKERKGSQLPINTDYIQAEHEVMANFAFDVQVAKTIKFVENNYNMVNALKKQAMALNHEGIMEHFRAITEATPDVSAEQMYRRTLNTKQAMALSQLKELAADGDLPNGYGANDYSDLIDELAKAHLKTTVGGAAQQQMPEPTIQRLMKYLGWLVKQDHIPSKIAAGTFFKGVADKKSYIKRTLGRDFVTWRDLVPDTHRIWQPREGSTLYFTKSIPEQIAEELMSGAAQKIGITKDQLRSVMARGDRFREYVVPNEVGDTIDHLRPDGVPTMLGSIAKPLVKWWKFYELSSPRRFLRFRMRHISGQSEAMFVGNPSAFKMVPQAASDVYDYARNAQPSPEFKQWLERGGTGSSLLSAEIGELDKLHLFKRLYEAEKAGKAQKITEAVLQGYWKGARLSVDLAESVLRYAAYKDYLTQMRGNANRLPNNWGASRPDEVKALPDLRDRAYKMANDLLGAYDDISAMGRELRTSVYPFWSFQEINLKRAYRFFANNGYEAGGGAGGGDAPPPNSGKGADYTSDGWNAWRAGRKAAGTAAKKAPFLAYKTGKLLAKMSAFWGLLTAWNMLMFPKEYNDLTDEEKSKPTMILGRDKDGQVIHTPHLGAMAELLGWFGLDAPQRMVRDFLEGKITAQEAAVQMVKQPANRIIGGVTPLMKIPIELMTGKSYFPDAFKPQQIRDRMDYIAKQFNLENELDAAKGKPSRGYLNSWWNAAFDRVDRGSAAYYDIQDAKHAYLAKMGKGDDTSYQITPKSEALHNAKLALHFGDQEAYKKYLSEYLLAGGSFKSMNRSFKNMNPLAGLSKEDRIGFMATLTKRDQEKLSAAMRYYLLYLSPGEHTDDEEEEK